MLWDGFAVPKRVGVLAAALERIDGRRDASADLEGSIQIIWSDGTLAFPDVADDAACVREAAA